MRVEAALAKSIDEIYRASTMKVWTSGPASRDGSGAVPVGLSVDRAEVSSELIRRPDLRLMPTCLPRRGVHERRLRPRIDRHFSDARRVSGGAHAASVGPSGLKFLLPIDQAS